MMGTDEVLFERMSAGQRVTAALEGCPGQGIMTTSFGIQSAVLLHMVNEARPGIPVVFIDTGFLFEETLRFAEGLTERLGLNLKTYRPMLSAEELVERHGKLWERGKEGLEKYNGIVKVEPMGRALEELRPEVWFAGLRRGQARSRSGRSPVEKTGWGWKVYPLIDWTDRDVYLYLKKHGLPYHPLWDKGYLTVGDWHSSAPLGAGTEEEATRFGGVKRECGLHDLDNKQSNKKTP